MCRGANLGTCCEQGCDERITCQDTGGYCNAHDPTDWDVPRTNVADDPEKRRIYDLARVTSGITQLEADIESSGVSLAKLRQRQAVLASPASSAPATESGQA